MSGEYPYNSERGLQLRENTALTALTLQKIWHRYRWTSSGDFDKKRERHNPQRLIYDTPALQRDCEY
eukprot:2687927-Pyramimonas_sp.AAC.2